MTHGLFSNQTVYRWRDTLSALPCILRGNANLKFARVKFRFFAIVKHYREEVGRVRPTLLLGGSSAIGYHGVTVSKRGVDVSGERDHHDHGVARWPARERQSRRVE